MALGVASQRSFLLSPLQRLDPFLLVAWTHPVNSQIPYQVHIVPTGFTLLHLGAHVVQCAGAESAGLVVLPKASSTFLKTYVSERCQVPVVLV